MKIFVLILIISCIFNSAFACSNSDCNACSDITACKGVSSSACVWNYGDDSCDPNPNLTISDCTIYNNLKNAC